MSCIVNNCEGIHSLRHYLPKNDKLRRVWLIKLQRQDLIVKPFHEVCNLKVCGNHFQSANYRNPASYQLNRNTVPIPVQTKEDPPAPQLELTVKTTLEVSKKTDTCLARGCDVSLKSKSTRMHRVPKRTGVREQWLQNIGREDLLKVPYSNIMHRYICGAHFDTSQYCFPGSVNLLRTAVPRLLHSDNVSLVEMKMDDQIEDEIIATGEVTAPLLCDNKMLLKTKSTYSKHKYQMTFKDDTPAPQNVVTANAGTSIETQHKSLDTENEVYTSESKSNCNISIPEPTTTNSNNKRINNNSKQTNSNSNSKKRKYNETEQLEEDKYDDKLLSILEEIKSLPNFLDVIFGFLYRRTDYYQISAEPNLGVGLPKGVAQKLLWQTFKKYENKEEMSSINSAQVLNEEPISAMEKVKDTRNKSDVRLFDTYNGAVFENYAWSQSINDLDIQIKIPDKITCKQLQVDIASSNILIKLKDTDTVYLQGELCKKCKVNETVWSLGGHLLQIHLEKASESWWDCLLKAEPRLDFNKMDCLQSEEVRAKIKEIAKSQTQIS